MNIIDIIRNSVLKFLRLDELTYNPESEKFTFIDDMDAIRKQNLQAYKVWYKGDSDELLNFYTNQEIYGNNKNPIYNRNKRNFFWGRAADENIKRVHSGLANAAINILSMIVGDPKIDYDDPDNKKIVGEDGKVIASAKEEIIKDRIKRIIEDNDLLNILKQEQTPMTLTQGYGGFSIDFDTKLSKTVIIQFHEAEDVKFFYSKGRLVSMMFQTYYQVKNKNYLLLDSRRVLNGDSIIEYRLFLMKGRNGEVEPVDLSVVPELAGLQDVKIEGFPYILGVPCKYYYDPDNKEYGLSILHDKLDILDDLDQSLTQRSRTTLLSTPVEYVPDDLLKRSKDGKGGLATDRYDRVYVKKPVVPNGDGAIDDGQIVTTQPQLNFNQYTENELQLVNLFLMGRISPATMGIDIAKKDNAEAQREKEKVTTETRNHLIDRNTTMLKQLMSRALVLQEFLDDGVITQTKYDLTIKYDGFANPSFENELAALGPAWANGEISTEKYVEMLWGDKLSKEDKEREIQALEERRNQDSLTLGDFEPNVPNENGL